MYTLSSPDTILAKLAKRNVSMSQGKFGEKNADENVCVDCPRGQYQDQQSLTTCKSCPPGKKGGSKGSYSIGDCENCPIGKISLAGQAQCESCPDGKSSYVLGGTHCYNCASGTYSLNGSGCLACPDGQIQYSNGQSSCEVCPAGKNTRQITEMSLTKNVTKPFPLAIYKTYCEDCPIGKYSATGYTACVPCFAGKHQNETGQASCKLCAQGKFTMEKGQIECKNCENTDYTTYQDEQGQIECKRCPKGKYETEQGQTSCKTCQNGFTTNTLGSNVCSMCEPGYRGIGGLCYTCNHAEYQDEYGQVECKLCPGGQFAPVDGKGHTECQTCPLGYYGLNKYKDPIEYKLINTKEWMRNCDACPTKNYWGHGRCSVFTETTKSECASAGGNWKTYEKCRDIPGNEIWDTTIRTKYECRDAWLNFLTNDEKEELLQDGTFPPQNDKYQPVCSYAPGKKCQPSTCSDPNEKWEYPPSIYFNQNLLCWIEHQSLADF